MDGKGRVNKGKTYERKIAKILSNAFKTDVQRTGGSGAYRGIETAYNESETVGKSGFVGDLFFPNTHPMSLFNYELKNHDKVSVTNIIKSTGEMQTFINQVITDSTRLGGVGHTNPCLIIHVKNEDDYVLIPYEPHVYNQLVKDSLCSIIMLNHNINKLKFSNKENTDYIYHYQMILTNLDGFTKIDPKLVSKYYKNLNWNKFNKKIKGKEVNTDDMLSQLMK